jgi:alkylhydroperoxidase family enzyme
VDPRSIPWSECIVPATTPSDALRADIATFVGRTEPSMWLGYLAPVPWLCRAKARLGLSHAPIAFISRELADLIALVVSQESSCRYCYGVTRAYLQLLGRREEEIDRLERDLEVDDVGAPERAALAFARKLTRANPRVSPADYRQVADAGWSPEQMAEIAGVASAACFMTRLASMLALPPPLDEPVRSWPQAMVDWMLRRAKGRPRYALDAPITGARPASALVAALGRSPLARVLRDCVDQALDSPVLPLRTKLMLLAVTAKALGCGACEREACLALSEAGVPEAEVAHVLTHLGDGERDAPLLSLARDAAFVSDPAILQCRVREATVGLEPPAILEAVGMIALGNLLGRLSAVLESC